MGTLKVVIVEGLAQLRSNWKLLSFLYIPILILFLVIALVSRSTTGLTMSYFTRDVTAVGDLPFYAGLISQMGAILWSATAAICLFTALLLQARDQSSSTRRFLTQAGLLTLVLVFDDVFLLHDSILPEYLGIREMYIYIVYLVMCLGFLLLNFQEILTSEYSILGLSFLMFGISIFFDGAHLDKYEQLGLFFSENIQTFLEDAPKFVGIATWALYFTRYAVQSQLQVSFPVVSLHAGRLSPLPMKGYKPAANQEHDSHHRTLR